MLGDARGQMKGCANHHQQSRLTLLAVGTLLRQQELIPTGIHGGQPHQGGLAAHERTGAYVAPDGGCGDDAHVRDGRRAVPLGLADRHVLPPAVVGLLVDLGADARGRRRGEARLRDHGDHEALPGRGIRLLAAKVVGRDDVGGRAVGDPLQVVGEFHVLHVVEEFLGELAEGMVAVEVVEVRAAAGGKQSSQLCSRDGAGARQEGWRRA